MKEYNNTKKYTVYKSTENTKCNRNPRRICRKLQIIQKHAENTRYTENKQKNTKRI